MQQAGHFPPVSLIALGESLVYETTKLFMKIAVKMHNIP